MDVSNGEGDENEDFEDENEGPMVAEDDMLTIDAVYDSLVYNIQNIEGNVEIGESEILKSQPIGAHQSTFGSW